MTANLGFATSGSQPQLISATYRRLQRLGFEDAEAANLSALKNGFAICSRPWAVIELTHLLFLRETCSTGRRWSQADDRADIAERTTLSAILERASAADGASASPAGSPHPENAVQSNSPVTLLTLLRAMAGPDATLDFRRPGAAPRFDATGDANREGG
jgi:hypothetical protein